MARNGSALVLQKLPEALRQIELVRLSKSDAVRDRRALWLDKIASLSDKNSLNAALMNDSIKSSLTSARSFDGRTVLMMAIARGNAILVSHLLAEFNFTATFLEHLDNTGLTALMIAARCGHGLFVSLLLQSGADSRVMASDGTTALWLAARGGHVDVVQLLLRHSEAVYGVAAEIAQATRHDGVTALMSASYRPP